MSATQTQAKASDIPDDGWVARLPARLRPFARLARLDRPIGTWLLLFPCWWGLALAGSLNLADYLLFGIGAVAMRGAGCTLNDMIDRDLDKRVARTADRPLASGEVSMTAAAAFIVLQTAIGFLVLVTFPFTTVLVGALSLVLVVIYPLMKRVTWWPQFFLGLAFNWGALLGWHRITGEIGVPALLLYVGGICWTLGYDTIYAHQDKADDEKVGIRSTARRFGDASRTWIGSFYAAAVLLWAAALFAAGVGPLAYLGLALTAAHLAWQIFRVKLDDPADCLVWFRANTTVGWFLLAGLIGSSWMR